MSTQFALNSQEKMFSALSIDYDSSMSEKEQDSELGRSKYSSNPSDHLNHLLNIGWDPKSPLIMRYAMANNLERQLRDWVEKSREAK